MITDSEFIKYRFGPVPSRGEKTLKKMIGNGRIKTTPRTVGGVVLSEVTAIQKCDRSVFTENENRIIDSVCDRFGSVSAVALSKLSHKEPAWHFATKMEKLSPELMRYGWEEDTEGL